MAQRHATPDNGTQISDVEDSWAGVGVAASGEGVWSGPAHSPPVLWQVAGYLPPARTPCCFPHTCWDSPAARSREGVREVKG
ncbi:hypothetical protein E2C01_066230 [Portunus trituberculatus]|uniref:Uncharacterized protein n=1 Tax=Portunus trituberculatus TaxID=210409 RepID=A0A5B7HTA7_PORTR|nr:hypothetical protein [Portunus trituberculatus]